jgi:hypothetical protein
VFVIDTLSPRSLLGNTDTLDRLANADSERAHFRTDSVDTLDDTFLESPSVSPDSPDIVCRTSALSVLDQAHPENFPAVSDFVAKPESACPSCRSGQWWQLPGQIWHCRTCEPNMPPTATTLTLPCHTEQVPPVGSHAGLDRMIENACEGLGITPEQLRQELIEDGDIPTLASGELTPQALRVTAETLAALRSSKPLNNDPDREARRQQVLTMLTQEPDLQ